MIIKRPSPKKLFQVKQKPHLRNDLHQSTNRRKHRTRSVELFGAAKQKQTLQSKSMSLIENGFIPEAMPEVKSLFFFPFFFQNISHWILKWLSAVTICTWFLTPKTPSGLENKLFFFLFFFDRKNTAWMPGTHNNAFDLCPTLGLTNQRQARETSVAVDF